MGRKKVSVEFLEPKRRTITFIKRWEGLAKKANDLQRLTGAWVYIMVSYDPGNNLGEKVRVYTSEPSVLADPSPKSDSYDFSQDMACLSAISNRAFVNRPAKIDPEITCKEDYEEVVDPERIVKDENGNPLKEYKKKTRVSYMKDAEAKNRKLKGICSPPSLISWAEKLALQDGTEVGKNKKKKRSRDQQGEGEKTKKTKKKKRSKNRDPPIIQDDAEICEAVGEEPPTPPQIVIQSPVVKEATLNNVTEQADGMLHLSQTSVKIVQKDLIVDRNLFKKGLNISQISNIPNFASPHKPAAPKVHFHSDMNSLPGVRANQLSKYLTGTVRPLHEQRLLSLHQPAPPPSPILNPKDFGVSESGSMLELLNGMDLSAFNLSSSFAPKTPDHNGMFDFSHLQ